MKALHKIEPAFGLHYRDVPKPTTPLPGEVIVAVGATGVCGTDVHIYEWTGGYDIMKSAMPVTIGHEFAGWVAAAGADARGLAEGMPIAIRPSVVCGRCANCRAGNSDLCTQRKGIGVTRDGALASHVRVPAENCIGVPDGPRLAALKRMGFGNAIDAGDRSLAEALEPYLAAGKFDAVIEATGASHVVQQGLDVLKKRGVFVAAGIQPQPVMINLTKLVREHQQIRGSYRSPVSTWQRVVGFLSANVDLAREMISHRLPLDGAIEGLELSRTKAASKVVIVQ